MGGVVNLTGPTDEDGYPCGVAVGDLYPGTLMALGLVSAIHHARIAGVGQFFDVAMYDAMLAYSGNAIGAHGHGVKHTRPQGKHSNGLLPFGLFPTKDGSIAIGAPGPEHWKALCTAMDRPDLAEDDRTRNNFVRLKNRDWVIDEISAWTATKTKAELMALFGGKVPSGPVNTAADIYADPHVDARNMLIRYTPPGDNPEVAIVGSPIKFTSTPANFYRIPPKLGEHTEEVLNEFGIERETPNQL